METKICPACGVETKVSDIRVYLKGTFDLWVHRKVARPLPFPHIEILESCYIEKENKNALGKSN